MTCSVVYDNKVYLGNSIDLHVSEVVAEIFLINKNIFQLRLKIMSHDHNNIAALWYFAISYKTLPFPTKT